MDILKGGLKGTMMSNKVVLRIIATVVALVVWSWVQYVIALAAPLISAPMAGHQFDNSNVSYFIGRGSLLFNGDGLPSLLLLAILVVIWWKPIRAIFTPLILLFLLTLSVPSFAYYDKSDYAEPHYILPNQSAFWVPDNGSNKDTQAQFGSEAYYAAHKIPAKLFMIPHTKLPDSGLWSNYYVPAGRLYIVDRTPFVQEWTMAGRGTAKHDDEAFHCQTKEGLNITAEVTMAATVTDANSPQYLYHFGVQTPAGNLNDPQVIFTSVLYSKSLTEVMDSVGRDAVGALVCDEFSTRTFDQANSDMAKEMQDVRQKATALLGSWGITVDFMGWFGTFTFDDSVQKAINNAYEAKVITPQLDTLKQYADITVKQGLAKGLADHGLPQNLIAIPTDLMGRIGGIFGAEAGRK